MPVEGHILWDIAGFGLWILLVLIGFFALVLPGRFQPAEASRFGLGRHVEALLLVSILITFALGTRVFGFGGNVPVFVGSGGVVAVSIMGALVPVVLAIHFLVAAGIPRMLVSVVPLLVVSLAAFFTTATDPQVGIFARAPYFFLPALLAAAGGLLVGWGSLRALPLSYAYGSLGGLIGADMLRIDWIVGTPLTAASIGGADAMDLVFLMGLWSAAFASVPFAPRLLRMHYKGDPWRHVASLAHERRHEAALAKAQALVEADLQRWAAARGVEEHPREAVLHRSGARPVLEQAQALWDTPQPWEPAALRQVLENLRGLARRLRAPALLDTAPLSKRVLAGLVDSVPVFVVAGLAMVVAFQVTLEPLVGESEQATAGRQLVFGVILVVWSAIATHLLYPFVSEWVFRGRTLGKMLFDLQVRRLDGSVPSGWDCFVRNLARLLDLMLLYLIPLFSEKDEGHARLGDYFAGTYVAVNMTTSIQAETNVPSPMPVSEDQWSLETTRPPR